MRLWFNQFTAIASNALLEVIRQPLFLLITTTAIVVTGVMPLFIWFSLGEEVKVTRDGALALQWILGLVAGTMASSVTLYREIESGTASAVLCKPVSRTVFFLAKFAGVAVALALFCLLDMIAALLGVRVASLSGGVDWWAEGPLMAAPAAAYGVAALNNFWFRRPFVSQAFGLLIPAMLMALAVACLLGETGKLVPCGSLLEWTLAPAAVLIGLAVLTLAAIAISLSTRMKPLYTATLCGGILLIGLMSDYFFGRSADQSVVSAACYAVIPNWQHFWVVDALSGESAIPWRYVLNAGLYAGCYIMGVLCLGMLAFRRVEIR